MLSPIVIEATQFKAHCLRLLDEVAETDEELVNFSMGPWDMGEGVIVLDPDPGDVATAEWAAAAAITSIVGREAMAGRAKSLPERKEEVLRVVL